MKKSKTKTTIPDWAKATLIAVATIVLGGLLWWQLTVQGMTMRLQGHSYSIQIMRTNAELQKGLSGTTNLPAGHAMLFVFPSDNSWGMWMKDMKYPIDMVWLDSDNNVVYTVRDAKPSSYPNTVYRPNKNARYVVELPSGTIDKTGIKVGDPSGLPSGI